MVRQKELKKFSVLRALYDRPMINGVVKPTQILGIPAVV